VIPGLRSLTRGYYLPPLRGSLTGTNQLEFMITALGLYTEVQPNNSWDLSADGLFSQPVARPLPQAVLT
jgi:hypothetical protein